MCDSAVSPCLSVCLAFLHKHFPQWSPLLGPFRLSLCSQQPILPQDCPPISMLQPPDAALSRGLVSLSRYIWLWKDCLCDYHSIWTVTDQLLHYPTVSNPSPLFQAVAPIWGSDLCFGFPMPQVQIHFYSLSFHLPPTPTPSFVLLSFAWFYFFFFPGGEVLLPALSWCSVGSSVSRGVLLMYPWREVCSTSTYSSAILDLYWNCV